MSAVWFSDPFFIFYIFIIFMTAASFGSFLNVVAYRLVFDKPFFSPRSKCPHCQSTIAWYYLIPVFSYLFLRGKAACCGESISYLYPLLEFLTGVVFTAQYFLYAFNDLTQLIYLLPFAALLVAIRTDLEAMVILSLPTLILIPVGFVAAHFGWLSITLTESILGAVFGYGLLWLINRVVLFIKGRQGIGEGDMELMALVGSFWGVYSVAPIIWIASIMVSVMAIILSLIRKKGNFLAFIQADDHWSAHIPFGPGIALATFFYHFFMR